MGGVTLQPLPEQDLLEVIKGAAGVWDSLRGSRIFVTGATGFFGRWFLESLCVANSCHGLDAHVIALSRNPEDFLGRAPHLSVSSKIEWMAGSVATITPGSVKGRRFTHVIHLATEADHSATREDPAAARDVILGGTRRALDIALAAGAERFLFTSTGAVYGRQPNDVPLIDEGISVPEWGAESKDPEAVGAAAKRAAELECLGIARGHKLSCVVARCFSFSGPGVPLAGKFAFGTFMADAVRGGRIQIKGDGTPIRSYLYASDMCAWLWSLLVRGDRGGIYNVGSECEVSIRRLAETIARELKAPGVEVQGLADPGAGIHRYVPSTRKVREQLGVRESVKLVDGIQRTAAWLRR